MSEKRYLVDSHILIWTMQGDDRVPQRYRDILADGKSAYVSMASLWEISIKMAIGKLHIEADVVATLQEYQIDILPITIAHIDAVRTLPHHHRDPFDRMLVAQAMTENLTLLTADRNIPLYGVAIA